VSPKRKKISPKDYEALNRRVMGVRFPPGQDKAQLLADRKQKLAKRGRSK
jgi:hypothetical protein